MTNQEIIFDEVNNKYHTAEQRRAILALAYTPEELNARCAQLRFENMTEEQQRVQAEKVLLAGLFHTFDKWKKLGKSVKTGEKAAINTKLWKMDDRPRKEKKDLTPDALTKAAQDQRPDGNYYKAPAHLFHIGQVENTRPTPAGRFKSIEDIKAYNRMLADQRKAAKAAAEQAASAPAPAVKAEAPAKPTTKPAKKTSKPASAKTATKPTTTASAPAPVPAPVEIAPVQQLDFESIAADLLA